MNATASLSLMVTLIKVNEHVTYLSQCTHKTHLLIMTKYHVFTCIFRLALSTQLKRNVLLKNSKSNYFLCFSMDTSIPTMNIMWRDE